MKSENHILPAELVSFTLPYRGVKELKDKTIRVYLPERAEGETLPVLYMTDGQSIFDPESNKKGCWFTREASAEVTAECGKKAILVGIHADANSMKRTEELTPGSIGRLLPPPLADDPMDLPEDFPTLPKDKPRELLTQDDLKKIMDDMIQIFVSEGEIFADFVVNQVIPAVEERFPVKTGRENRAVLGSSSGGLEMFFIGMSHPDLFSGIGALSPVFDFYYEEDLTKWIDERLGDNMPFVYLYFGTGAKKELRFYEGSRPTFEYLKAHAPKGKIKEVIDPLGIHHESCWTPIFKDFLLLFLTGRF